MDTKQHLVCVVMGQNCEKFIGMCLESIKDADAIVYCDGRSTDKTLEIVSTEIWAINHADSNKEVRVIENIYNQEDKQMNGKQRNFYLEYVKKNYPNDWVLCLDAD